MQNNLTTFENRLSQQLEKTTLSNNLRQLTLTPHTQNVINLSSNDYLNLSKHPKVIQASQIATEKFGTSSSGSPVVTSYLPIHQELEDTMTSWLGFKECLIWTSGFTANKSILETLLSKNDLVLADRLIHISTLQGILQTGAQLIRYHHCNTQHLEDLLKKHSKNNRLIWILTESLFSMDGDYPHLPTIANLKQHYPFIWILDEAHAVGWYGPQGQGLAAHYQVIDQVDIFIATLGKSLASQGAISLFHNPSIKKFLINYSKDFIYSTYPSPSNIAAANQATQLIQHTLHREQPLWHQKATQLKHALAPHFPNLPTNESPILPLILKDNHSTLLAQKKLQEINILTSAIRPPSVPKNTSRLRLSLNKDINPETLSQQIIKTLRDHQSHEN